MKTDLEVELFCWIFPLGKICPEEVYMAKDYNILTINLMFVPRPVMSCNREHLSSRPNPVTEIVERDLTAESQLIETSLCT